MKTKEQKKKKKTKKKKPFSLFKKKKTTEPVEEAPKPQAPPPRRTVPLRYEKAPVKDEAAAQNDASSKPQEKDGQKKKTKKKFKLPKFHLGERGKKAIVFFAVLLLTSAALIGLFIAVIALDSAVGRESDFRVNVTVLDQEQKKHTSTIRRSTVYKNGDDVIYVNMNLVTEMLGVVTIGDGERMQYVLRSDSEKYVLLRSGSRVAEINGVEVALPGPIIIEGKNVYVPQDFFAYYCSGIDVHYSVNNKRLNITLDAESPFVFAMMQIEPMNKIPEPIKDIT